MDLCLHHPLSILERHQVPVPLVDAERSVSFQGDFNTDLADIIDNATVTYAFAKEFISCFGANYPSFWREKEGDDACWTLENIVKVANGEFASSFPYSSLTASRADVEYV